MAIITLTTDLGSKDYYLSSVKGVLYSGCQQLNIVDITHEIPKFDTEVASYVLKNSYLHFPEGTIHIIDVNTGFGELYPYVIVYADKHYFIGADNGIFSLILEQKKPEKIVIIDLKNEYKNSLFPARDIFAKVANHIINTGDIKSIGEETSRYTEKINLAAYADATNIRGMVVYIDSYGNVITNITKELFDNSKKDRSYGIQLKPSIKYSSEYGLAGLEIETIHDTYDDVPDGEVLALFNSSGHLEIAINKGNASGLLGLKNREIIRINFYDNQNSENDFFS